jgi:hypothetical protein
MASTNEILARLGQWARQIEAHDWRADRLTSRDFTADLAALVVAVASKDRAIEDLIEAGYVGPETPPVWMAICARAHAARG